MFALFLAAMAQDRGARGDDAAFDTEDPDAYVPAPKTRLWYTNAVFGRVNPLGLTLLHKVGIRQRLSTKDSILFQDTYAFAGANIMVTPAYSRLGLYAEGQVLSLFRVFAQLDGVGYYGTFDQVITFAPDERYSDQAIGDRADDASSALGWVFTGGATLRAKVGPIAVRSTAQVTRYDLGGLGNAYFYDQFWDRLAPNKGWMILKDSDLLVVTGKLRAGVRYTFSETFDGSKGTDASLAHHRVGPLFAWQFADKKPGARFNQPTLFVLAQWWLQHPYRTGDEQPAALPVIAIGFAFNGDHKVWGAN